MMAVFYRIWSVYCAIALVATILMASWAIWKSRDGHE